MYLAWKIFLYAENEIIPDWLCAIVKLVNTRWAISIKTHYTIGNFDKDAHEHNDVIFIL